MTETKPYAQRTWRAGAAPERGRMVAAVAGANAGAGKWRSRTVHLWAGARFTALTHSRPGHHRGAFLPARPPPRPGGYGDHRPGARREQAVVEQEFCASNRSSNFQLKLDLLVRYTDADGNIRLGGFLLVRGQSFRLAGGCTRGAHEPAGWRGRRSRWSESAGCSARGHAEDHRAAARRGSATFCSIPSTADLQAALRLTSNEWLAGMTLPEVGVVLLAISPGRRFHAWRERIFPMNSPTSTALSAAGCRLRRSALVERGLARSSSRSGCQPHGDVAAGAGGRAGCCRWIWAFLRARHGAIASSPTHRAQRGGTSPAGPGWSRASTRWCRPPPMGASVPAEIARAGSACRLTEQRNGAPGWLREADDLMAHNAGWPWRIWPCAIWRRGWCWRALMLPGIMMFPPSRLPSGVAEPPGRGASGKSRGVAPTDAPG